jgi:aminoglycoside phosphotransferase (APT) family kinase protein
VVLKEMHERWLGGAEGRWPWLKRDGHTALAIGDLYDGVWSGMAGRPDLTPVVRDLGDRFAGKVAEFERAEARAARRALIHGDASLCNTRTSPDGVVAFLDWEDVRSANGCIDLTWLLVSPVRPDRWDDVISAYGADASEFMSAMPNAATQGILSLADSEPGSEEASQWVARIEAAAARLT